MKKKTKKATKKPKKRELVSMLEYSRMKKVSYTTIKRHVAKGRITRVDGKIDPDLADEQLNKNIDVTFAAKSKLTKKGGKAPDASTLFNQSKARREQAKASLAELELAEKAGELITVAQVKKEAETLYRTYRDGMLNVVVRATKKLLGETNEFKFRNVLKKEIENAIKQVK